MCLYVHVCACMCMYVYVCPYMCMYVYVCPYMCKHVPESCLPIHVHACSCMCMYVHVCACMCMYVHVCARMCISVWPGATWIYAHVLISVRHNYSLLDWTRHGQQLLFSYLFVVYGALSRASRAMRTRIALVCEHKYVSYITAMAPISNCDPMPIWWFQYLVVLRRQSI
jgi:hypothetical protein